MTENKELLGRFRSTKDKLWQEMEDAGARARQEAGALEAKAAEAAGRSESLEEELGASRRDVGGLRARPAGLERELAAGAPAGGPSLLLSTRGPARRMCGRPQGRWSRAAWTATMSACSRTG